MANSQGRRVDFFEVYPTVEILAESDPADMARVILATLTGIPNPNFVGYVARIREKLNLLDWHHPALRPIAEGWDWLERYGLLLNDPGQSSGVHRMLSRRAQMIISEDDFKAFRKEVQSAYDVLDDAMKPSVWPLFYSRRLRHRDCTRVQRDRTNDARKGGARNLGLFRLTY